MTISFFRVMRARCDPSSISVTEQIEDLRLSYLFLSGFPVRRSSTNMEFESTMRIDSSKIRMKRDSEGAINVLYTFIVRLFRVSNLFLQWINIRLYLDE